MSDSTKIYHLDCTFRDGGYYTSWVFPDSIVQEYLYAMEAVQVDAVELGFRSMNGQGFRGASAFTTEEFLETLDIPASLDVVVMVNASELLSAPSVSDALEVLFPVPADDSRVDVVRVACHPHEVSPALDAASWLKSRGYRVGFNLMQIYSVSADEVVSLAKQIQKHPVDVLYFADSTGSMSPDNVREVAKLLRSEWPGDLGVHTHDNLGLALMNSLAGIAEGIRWLDSTVTGMGRGPGNAKTEELIIEISEMRGEQINLIPLATLIRGYFQPLKEKNRWGTNPYYYLAGKYSIHPTYIQQMLNDPRYEEEDVLSVIDYLRTGNGNKFSSATLISARRFYADIRAGTWSPRSAFEGQDILLLGAGPGLAEHAHAIERYIVKFEPNVIGLNIQTGVRSELINFRAASHPFRLLADSAAHAQLDQPLITPHGMLPEHVKSSLGHKEVLDFGLEVREGTFEFEENSCVIPSTLVLAYALGIATSGRGKRIVLAGFDGYAAGDPRLTEVQDIFDLYCNQPGALPLLSITPTNYVIPSDSVYFLEQDHI